MHPRIFSMKLPVYHKIIFCACLLALSAVSTHAQKMSKVDSLKLQLGTDKGANRQMVLYQIAYELFDVDNPQALTYADHAYKASLEQGDSAQIVASGLLLGQLLRRADRPEETVEMLTKMLPLARRHNQAKVKTILNSLAIAYTFLARYDKALEVHFQSLVIREQEGDKKQISITLMNIGLVYYKLSQNDLALEYYLKSLEAKREVGDTFDLDRLYINIGLSYNDLREFPKAQDYFDLAFQLCKNCRDEIKMEVETGLGVSLVEQRKYDESLPHLLKALELSTSGNNQRFQLENLLRLAEVATAQGDLKATEDYLRQAEAHKVIGQYKELHRSLYQRWASYYTLSRNFEKAYEFEKRYSQLNDSILSRNVMQNLLRVQTQHAERENLAIIADKEQLLVLQDELISQQRTLNWLLGAVIVLTTALVVVIYRNYQSIKRVNTDLATAKQVIEDQNRFLDHQVQEKTKELVDSNESLQKVNDELDNFIYKTSHDIRGPLASLKGIVNLAILDVKDEKAQGYLSKLDLTAEKLNIILTRLLIVNKINHAEHFEPIIQEILSLEMKKGVPSKIKIDYDVDTNIRLVSDREMVRLILENLIDNAIKFYNESERVDSFVQIAVQSHKGLVTVHVVDNGVGIDLNNRDKIFQMFVRASERSDTGGIGLYLAKLATEKLFGQINLITEGKLTEFIVQFPTDLQCLLDKRREERRRIENETATEKVRDSAA